MPVGSNKNQKELPPPSDISNPTTLPSGLTAQNKALLERLSRYVDLPSPAGIAMRITELCRDPNVSLNKVAEVVSVDPALTAKLLRVGNSAMYARRRKVENVRQAITLFGLNGTLTVALSFSIVRSLRSHSGQGLDFDAFWRRSIATATGAQLFAERIAPQNKETVFLAGLLLHVGMLALAQVRPSLYDGLSSLPPSHVQIKERECESVGIDHCATTIWLLQQWQFPELLRNLINNSLDIILHPDGDKNAGDLQAKIVAISSDMAELWRPAAALTQMSTLLRRARTSFGMDENAFLETLEKVKASTSEIASLYDVEITEPAELDMIIGEAKEIATLRNLQIAQAAHDLIATTQQLEDRTRTLEEETRRDVATGLLNRINLQQTLTAELEAARQRGWPLAVIFIDIDGFKGINDEFGHQAGDMVIQKVARILADCARSSDIVARYGGDEFTMILPGSGEDAAAICCNRILDALRNSANTTHEGEKITVTASLGVAVQSGQNNFTDTDGLLRAADEAMYIAKSRGRNQFALHSAKNTH